VPSCTPSGRGVGPVGWVHSGSQTKRCLPAWTQGNPTDRDPSVRTEGTDVGPTLSFRQLSRATDSGPCENQIVRSPPQPQIRQVYPVNLSILMTGGKETNQDVRSSSERSGLSSNLKSGGPRIFRIVVLRSVIAGHASTGTSPLKRGRRGGRDPRIRPRCREPTALTFRRVGLFGNAARIG
jgi:hypothetical protein